MYTVDSGITDLNIRERGIIKMLFSMNIPEVAMPDSSPEQARCYIVFFRDGANLSSYICLYFPAKDRRMFYTYSANPFPFEALTEVEEEAHKFADDMGFILDELNIGGISLEEKNRWIDEQPAFGQKKQPEVKTAAQPAKAPRQAAAAPKQTAPQQPAPPTEIGQAPQPQQPSKRPAPAQKAVQQKTQIVEAVAKEPLVAETEQGPPPMAPDEVLREAVKAGVVKEPKPQLKKEIRSATGVVPRDKEALARLMASF